MAEEESHSHKRITIDFWQLSAKEDLMQYLIRRFEKENPDIKVRLQLLSWESGKDKITISIAAGNAPDICELGSTWVTQYASAGVLRDITQDVTNFKDDFYHWNSVTYQDKIYGAPWLAGTRVMLYNRDLFDRAGLPRDHPPDTWGELLEFSKRIHDLGPETYGFGIFAGEQYSVWQQFLPFAWGNGGGVLSEDLTASILDGPETVEALEYYQKLKPYSLVDRQAQINQLFAHGKIGIQISGPWNFTLIPNLNPKLNFGVALLPKPDKETGIRAAFAGGEALSIMASSKHPKEALRLIKFLIREDNALEITKLQQNVVPSFKGSIRNSYFHHHPNQRIFFQQLQTAIPPPSHAKWQDIQEHVTRAIEETVFNDRDPQEALSEASQKINQILHREKGKTTLFNKLLTWGLGLLVLLFIGWKVIRRKESVPGVKPFILKRDYASYVFMLPWILTFIVFGLYPLVYSVIISFTEYNLLSPKLSFVGLQNYIEILKNPDFHSALWHTFVFAAGTIPFIVALSLFSAILINQKVPFKQLYQSGLFLPVSTSVIVIATIFSYLYSADGLVTQVGNTILDHFGLSHPKSSWLNDANWALPSIMAMNVWASFGYYMVLFLAGLQTIPHELYEAAEIDGAGEWQKFWHVTLPQLRPIMLFVIVINTIRSFQVFPEIFAMTKGGPLGSTTTVVYHLYELGFHRFEMGMASAMAYILLMIIMLFSVLQMKAFRFGDQGS